jgi:N-acetylglucosamine-6-phosphate deacetylase
MSIGHSDGTSEDLINAIESGFTHITHFYSAMSMVKRVNAFRVPGMIEGAYLSDGYTIELIADGCHLPADLLKLAYKVKGPERTALITDAIWAAGTTEGRLAKGPGGRELLIEDGVAKLPDRSVFAGSTSTMDKIVRTMVQLADVPLVEAVRMASATPARIIGVSAHKGTINPGMDADLVVLDRELAVRAVMVGGEIR